jgi:large repetitive protein
MFLKRVSMPVVLLLTLLLQFLPGTAFGPRPAAATSCDLAQFVADVTVPDGTIFGPGSSFVKTWRLKNIGSCTWTTSYSVVLTSGDQMGAPAVQNLPYSVTPGATVDVSVNMTTPSGNGHYRGNWKLRNASGYVFGVGGSASYVFWVDLYVNSSSTTGTSYDFVANYCSALWASGAGGLACPGSSGSANGFVVKVDAPQLETGSTSSTPGLLVGPQQVTGGWVKGFYPAFTVHSGDHFQTIINCAYNATSCYVNFRLDYQIGGGSIHNFFSFNERYDGLYFPVNVDLSSLAGQSVNFILYMADVSGHGTPSGDTAMWVGPKITGTGGGYIPPISPSSTCDKGAFVQDVTIPDGTTLNPGASFTKTWRIRNVGSCTWTTDYALIFAFGNQMGASSPMNLPSGVAPVVSGATADFSVNMVAPSTPGHYRSYWRFRNASGVQFGVGSGMITFFADIYVGSVGLTSSMTTITSDAPDASTPGQSVLVGVTVSGSSGTPTGTVSITGADSNCTITLTSGSGSCNVVFNSSGGKTLTAMYNGSSIYATSSDTESHTVSGVSPSTSTTSITTDNPDPSSPGQSVLVSVNVTGSGATPTGTVAITGSDSNCTVTLTSGSGSCNVIFNASGAKTLTATYGGDSNYTGSSDTESHTVGPAKAASATTITSHTPDPSVPGQAVVVSVTVNGAGAPTPSGTVDITGASTNCSILLSSSGSGSCSVVFNTAGAKTLTASYNGDASYATSSGTANHNAVKGSTTTSFTAPDPAPLDPSLPGQAFTVSVKVLGAGAKPTGTVSITGADINCTITLSNGTGSCNSVVFNTIGSPQVLTATYNGDGNYLSSTATLDHNVKNASTTVFNGDLPDPSNPGDGITVSVTVTGPGVAPEGVVAITGADTPCNITLTPGTGTGSCSVIFNTAGARVLTATYEGDPNYVGSTATTSHTVSRGVSTTAITLVNPAPSSANQSVSVTVTVTGSGVTPTGTVAITGASTSCTVTLSGGTGHCDVTFTATGAYTITATYSGDGNYEGGFITTPHTVS